MCRSWPSWWAARAWPRRSSKAPSSNGKSVVTANKELMAACGPETVGPRHSRRRQRGHGGQRLRRHPHPRGAARGHLGRPRGGPLRHSERHLQLHPHGDGKARRAARNGAGRGAVAGLCGGRPERRYRRLRRALQAGAAGGAGVRREDHALGYFHGGHPAHHPAGLPVRPPVEARRPAGLRGAQDGRRADPLRAAGVDSRRPPFWPACRDRTTRCG